MQRPGRILADTNAIIALLRGDEGVAELLDAAPEVLLSAVVLGELTYGALNSRAVDANLAKLSDLARQCRFVPVDEPIVAEYGRVKTELKKQGRPIPENDIWIAASVLVNDASLLTADAHFEHIHRLSLIRVPAPG